MTNNTSVAGTMHLRTLASLALSRKEGVAITVKQEHEAIRMRQQFNSMRFHDRKVYAKMYPDKEHPEHGRSPYDTIETKIVKENGEIKLIFRHVRAILSEMKITDLDTGKPITTEDL